MNYLSSEELARLYVEKQENRYFDELYKRHYPFVYGKCNQYIDDTELVNDMVQEVFIRLQSNLSSFRGNAKFTTWLYAITANYCADQLHQKNKRRQLFDPLDTDSETSSSAQEEETVLQTERYSLMWQLFHQLTGDEQRLLNLKYQDAYSMQDIALQQGLTVSSVKMRLKRSRDKLRKKYVEHQRLRQVGVS